MLLRLKRDDSYNAPTREPIVTLRWIRSGADMIDISFHLAISDVGMLSAAAIAPFARPAFRRLRTIARTFGHVDPITRSKQPALPRLKHDGATIRKDSPQSLAAHRPRP